MKLFYRQSWDELSRPERWGEAVRPAMEELEARLPAMLDASAWLYRNVSWSDLARIGEPGTHPPAGSVWPLMYMVGRYKKALLGVCLIAGKGCAPGSKSWKNVFFAAKGLPCILYAVDPEVPASMEAVLKDICRENFKARRKTERTWECIAGPAHIRQEAARLAGRGLVKEENGVWLPTERGEDAGLITLFTAGTAGKTERSIRWTPSTQKALSGGRAGPVPLQARIKRLELGLACQDAWAAETVQRLAEMPLADYFRGCPEVKGPDLARLQTALGLENGCLFRTAAAALFRCMQQAGDGGKREQLRLLAGMLALPVARMDEEERSFVVETFRKGQILA